MHAQARRLGDGAHEGGGRALAVGAGHVDHGRQGPLGASQVGEQAGDAVEAEVDQLGMEPAQPLEGGVVAAEEVGHRPYSSPAKRSVAGEVARAEGP